jgi:hypothetical protein
MNPKLRNVFRNTIFSDPDLNENGKASFTVSTGIDPTLLNYYKLKSDPNNKTTNTAGGSAVDTTKKVTPSTNN